MIRRLLKALILLAVLLLILPYGLVLLYALPGLKPVSTLMLYDLARGESYSREWVDFENVAPVLVQSVMMSEDGRYCAHDGVDWQALNTVLDDAFDGEATRGASTIPMQTVKNLFLWQSRSVIRKGLEVPLALFADYVWSKRRMMELYLNIAEWAPGIYGVGAASNFLFGMPADRLSAKQAALLAVTLPNPSARNPSAPSRGMRRLATTIEARARQSGAYIKCLYS